MNLWLLGRELILSTLSRDGTSPCADPAVCAQGEACEHDPSQHEYMWLTRFLVHKYFSGFRCVQFLCFFSFFQKERTHLESLLRYACRILALPPPPRAMSWPRHSTTFCYSENLRVIATQCTAAGRNASGARRNSFGTYLLRPILLLAAPH